MCCWVLGGGLYKVEHFVYSKMTEEQLSALFAKLKDDPGFQERFKDATNLDSALDFSKVAGFDVSKADWLKYQVNQMLELSDEELEGVSGGKTFSGIFGACGY
mgnify:CR=1 FL=1